MDNIKIYSNGDISINGKDAKIRISLRNGKRFIVVTETGKILREVTHDFHTNRINDIVKSYVS